VRDHKPVWFLTSNKGKFREAAAVAAVSGLPLKMLATKKIEIQSDSLRRIASFAAQEAANRLRISVITEDAGLFIDALRGFPGPYSSDIFKRLGTRGILKLMEDVSKRDARFYSAVAYCAPHRKAKCFTGAVNGTIGVRPRGSGGFGFDPIFVPTRGDGRTFAQMSVSEKNRISHRAISFRKLSRWICASRLERLK